VWTCEICMKYVLLSESLFTHTVVVGFHLHVGVEYLCIHYAGCYAGCYDVFVASGATTSEMKIGTTRT